MNREQIAHRERQQQWFPIPHDTANSYGLYPRVYGDEDAEFAGGCPATLAEVVEFLREYTGPGKIRLTFHNLSRFKVYASATGWICVTPYTAESDRLLILFNIGRSVSEPLHWNYRTAGEEFDGSALILWEPSTGSLWVQGWITVEEQLQDWTRLL